MEGKNIYFDTMIINGESIDFLNEVTIMDGYEKSEKTMFMRSGKPGYTITVNPTESTQSELKFKISSTAENKKLVRRWSKKPGEIQVLLINTKYPEMDQILEEMYLENTPEFTTGTNDGVEIVMKGKAIDN